jgi:hypothetical protein
VPIRISAVETMCSARLSTRAGRLVRRPWCWTVRVDPRRRGRAGELAGPVIVKSAG